MNKMTKMNRDDKALSGAVGRQRPDTLHSGGQRGKNKKKMGLYTREYYRIQKEMMNHIGNGDYELRDLDKDNGVISGVDPSYVLMFGYMHEPEYVPEVITDEYITESQSPSRGYKSTHA